MPQQQVCFVTSAVTCVFFHNRHSVRADGQLRSQFPLSLRRSSNAISNLEFFSRGPDWHKGFLFSCGIRTAFQFEGRRFLNRQFKNDSNLLWVPLPLRCLASDRPPEEKDETPSTESEDASGKEIQGRDLFALFDLPHDRLEVPWSIWSLGQMIAIWAVASVGAELLLITPVLVPLLDDPAAFLNFDSPDLNLPPRFQALLSAWAYVLTAGCGWFAIQRVTTKFQPLSPDLFRISLQGDWYKWGFGGFLSLIPLVNLSGFIQDVLANNANQDLMEIEKLVVEADKGQDWVVVATLGLLGSIIGPVWEEYFFRGFMLTTFARYSSTWNAIGLSAALFSLAHADFDSFLPIFAAGSVLGYLYARTRNLSTSILAHSLWNFATFLALIFSGTTITGGGP